MLGLHNKDIRDGVLKAAASSCILVAWPGMMVYFYWCCWNAAAVLLQSTGNFPMALLLVKYKEDSSCQHCKGAKDGGRRMGTFKRNVDATVDDHAAEVGIGMLTRDHGGCETLEKQCCSPTQNDQSYSLSKNVG